MTTPSLWLAVALCATLGATTAHAKLAGNGPQASASPVSAVTHHGKQAGSAAPHAPRVVPDPPPPEVIMIHLPDGTAVHIQR